MYFTTHYRIYSFENTEYSNEALINKHEVKRTNSYSFASDKLHRKKSLSPDDKRGFLMKAMTNFDTKYTPSDFSLKGVGIVKLWSNN